jgi:HD-GYP domain-containing protein (c-di-GMP phosphodiesterase class II)
MLVPSENAIDAIQRVVKDRDAYTAGHNQRVSIYAMNLANAIGLEADSIRAIGIGGRLHDVGKIAIKDEVLLKPTRLNLLESLEIQRHCAIGRDICEPLGLEPLVLDIVHHHHERLNGSGYPDGLLGSQIPLEVQIVCAADVVDALYSRRVYRDAYAMEDVWDILSEEASRGLHDTALVNECIRIMANGDLFKPARQLPPVVLSPELIWQVSAHNGLPETPLSHEA